MPSHLDLVLIPSLLRAVGGSGAEKITQQDVERCLHAQRRRFTEAPLADMFAEADFRQAGFLDASSLAAALDGTRAGL